VPGSLLHVPGFRQIPRLHRIAYFETQLNGCFPVNAGEKLPVHEDRQPLAALLLGFEGGNDRHVKAPLF
jgi:hypothetical protein